MEIGTTELIERTGATIRQVNYWCHAGVIPTITDAAPGTGFPRKFDDKIVPMVKLLVDLSRDYNYSLPMKILDKIAKNYSKGSVKLSRGVRLTWKT